MWVLFCALRMRLRTRFLCSAKEFGSFIFARQKSARKRMLAKMPRHRRESSLDLFLQISLGNVGVLFCGLGWCECDQPFQFIENLVRKLAESRCLLVSKRLGRALCLWQSLQHPRLLFVLWCCSISER